MQATRPFLRKRAPEVGGKAPGPALEGERLRVLRSWRWSSHRAFTGYAVAPAWLLREPLDRLCGGRGEAPVLNRAFDATSLIHPCKSMTYASPPREQAETKDTTENGALLFATCGGLGSLQPMTRPGAFILSMANA